MIHADLEQIIQSLEQSGVDSKQIQALKNIDRRIKFIEDLLGRHLPQIVQTTDSE